jgi:hypothetical protein
MSAAAAAAAAQRRRREQEEEEMTMANTDPSGTIEYKIIRSARGEFKNPAKFRSALDEEARAGWELVEKLDNSRARLRRSIECRKRDADLGQDAYRTEIGMSETVYALWIVAAVVLIIPLVIGLLKIFAR